MFKLINNYFNEIFKNKNIDNETINILLNEINDNINQIYKNDINKYFEKYEYFKNIYNINNDFINNVHNIQIYKEENNYLLLKCLYNNKKAIIKLFYNPFINSDLLYEQIVYLKIPKNKYTPKIYNIGYINLDILLNNDNIDIITNYMNDTYYNNIINNDIQELFKQSFTNLINNNENIDDYFLNYYKSSKKNSYLCNLLLFLNNKINKEIHITIMEDYTNYYNLLDYYNDNIIITDPYINLNNEIFIIISKIFDFIYILNNDFNIIHNNLLLQNIYIIKNDNNTYDLKFINFNMAYINNINNLSLCKYYNNGILNNFNNIIDYYIFINSLINDTNTNNILKPYNFFIYNKYNFKKINKMLFKKNKELRELLFKNHIYYINNINTRFCNNIIYNQDCNSPNIKVFNNKYFKI